MGPTRREKSSSGIRTDEGRKDSFKEYRRDVNEQFCTRRIVSNDFHRNLVSVSSSRLFPQVIHVILYICIRVYSYINSETFKRIRIRTVEKTRKYYIILCKMRRRLMALCKNITVERRHLSRPRIVSLDFSDRPTVMQFW